MATARLTAALLLLGLVMVSTSQALTSVQPSAPDKPPVTTPASAQVSPSGERNSSAAAQPTEAGKTEEPIISIFEGGKSGASLQLRLGAGCILSNYSALPVVAVPVGNDTGGSPSFRVALAPGFGAGEYVAHFTAFQLPPEDVIILRGFDDTGAFSSEDSSVMLAGSSSTGAFYSTKVTGSGVELTLYRTSETPPPPTQTARGVACYGFQIDEIRFRAAESASEELVKGGNSSLEPTAGDEVVTESEVTEETTASRAKGSDESVCGQDESVEAVCAPSAHMRNASQGVARLTIVKNNNMDVAYCTGFLLGCEGHLLTNQHCIGSWVDALNTDVEFHAESSVCGSNCTWRAACPGDVLVRSTTLVAVSEELDYALVSLVNARDATAAEEAAFPLLQVVGGYLQLRMSGPVDKEEIYVAQHPMGYGKRLAWTSNGQPGRIESLSVDACRAGDVGYFVDTQDGSSGSPVIATSDNTVVALHHCGGCLNGAIPSDTVIADLKAKGVLPTCAVSDA